MKISLITNHYIEGLNKQLHYKKKKKKKNIINVTEASCEDFTMHHCQFL